MDIFSVFTLLGGLAFFLFGMNVMSNSLERIAGGRLETALKKMTSNPFKSLALGAGITIAIQSSSAMTVMLVGLVNSGIMEFSQTIGVIMGADIGTTFTGWLLSLTGIESDVWYIKIFKPENFSPLFAFVGIVFVMMSKKNKRKDLGTILIGFAVLMYGMVLMKDSVTPLAETEEFQNLLIAFKNPLLSLLVGAVFTGIIQSSAASVGILMSLASATGTISYKMAIPIIMGLNIGTCVTAIISSIGVTKDAKRVSVAHISIKIIGATVWLLLFCLVTAIFDIPALDTSISTLGIATIHTIFNVATILLLLPFSNLIVKLAEKIIPDSKEIEENTFIDERLLSSPPLAVSQCQDKTFEMAEIAKKGLVDSLDLIFNYSEKKAAKVVNREQELDVLEDKLGTFMILLSQKVLTHSDSNTIAKLLHTISDFERIGDHSTNIMEIAQAVSENEDDFSEAAKIDLRTLFAALSEILNLTAKTFETNDVKLAETVEPLEEVIDKLTSKIKDRHISRLQSGKCKPELGILLSDLLINCERVSDHCSNVAVCVIQIANSTLDNHDYLNELRAERTPEFLENYEMYKQKYRLADIKG